MCIRDSITPEREVISLVPEEFIVDGFQGIRDPRGMMGIRLEMRGLIYTGPTTILHNLRKTVERAGIQVENIIISPLAMTRAVLNEGEREFLSLIHIWISQMKKEMLLQMISSLQLNLKLIRQSGC